MAITSARLLAILEAQTAQFEARMTAASAQLTRMSSTSTSARRGVNMLQGGLQQLAIHASGLPGPLGKIVSGLGALTVGSVAATGVLAFFGLLVLWMKKAADETKATQERLDGFQRQLLGLLPATAKLQEQLSRVMLPEKGLSLDALRDEATRWQTQLDKLAAHGASTSWTAARLKAVQDEINLRERLITLLEKQLDLDRKSALGTDAQQKVINDRLGNFLGRMYPGGLPLADTKVTGAATLPLRVPPFAKNINPPLEVGLATQRPRGDDPYQAAREATERLRESVINNFSMMAQMAILHSDNMAQAFTAAVFQIAQSLLALKAAETGKSLGLFGSLLGPIGALAGVVVGQLAKPAPVSVERYGSEALRQTQRALAEPETTSIVVVDSLTGARYTFQREARDTRRDAVQRGPGRV